MTDEPEDKGKDRVISMADFMKSSVESSKETGEDTPLEDFIDPSAYMPSVDEVMDFMMSQGLETVVILGQQPDGKFRFGSNMMSYEDTIFLMEAYKKIILDAVVGVSKKEDPNDE